MFYKPNFCCNCGEKIQRAEWKLLTSRRFCDVCKIENQGHELLPKAILLTGLVFGVFGFGSYLGGSTPVEPKASRLTLRPADSRGDLTLPAAKPQQLVAENGDSLAERPGGGTPSLSNLPGSSTKEQPVLRNPASQDPVYYCGALTKKGKPCSRRVKTKTRCWQHSGQPAELEPRTSPDVY